jgi:hypothetical protein
MAQTITILPLCPFGLDPLGATSMSGFLLRLVRNNGLTLSARLGRAGVLAGTWLASLAGLSSPATAQDLATQVAAARQGLNPDRLPQPEAARSQLLAQMQAFEQYLGVPGNPNGQAWLAFLKWDQLKTELESPEPNLRNLHNIEMTFRQNYWGLEYAPFVATRNALDYYIRALRYGTRPEQTIQTLASQLDSLAAAVDPASDLSDADRARNLGLVMNYLHESQQAPQLVAALHATFSHPNVQVSASEAFINRVVSRPVVEPAPVDEVILGTRVLGQSCTVGRVTADLLPNFNGVSVCLRMDADFSSNNIGYNRGVKIYTTGSADIHAAKFITLTPAGLFTQPATASANLNTQINDIEHHLRIVRRIASRQAAKQSPEANAIGEARLVNRLANQFNRQVDEELAESGSGNLFNQERPALARIGIPKPQLLLSSSDQHVFGALRQATPFQLAALRPAPAVVPGAEVVAGIHQSVASNLADLFLGGRTVHSSEMDDLVRQFVGSVPPELQEEAEGEEWSITFADFHPLEVEFKDGLARVAVRATQMTRADQELNQAVTISAVYQPIVQGGEVVFERQGEVQLDFAGASRGIRQVTLRSFLKGKFERLFRERTEPQRLTLGRQMPNVPPLSLAGLRLEDGWAQVALQ